MCSSDLGQPLPTSQLQPFPRPPSSAQITHPSDPDRRPPFPQPAPPRPSPILRIPFVGCVVVTFDRGSDAVRGRDNPTRKGVGAAAKRAEARVSKEAPEKKGEKRTRKQ